MIGFTHSAHLLDITVKLGQNVKSGDIIGHLGSTGSSTSPHCHWEAWKIDPRTLGNGWQDRYTTGMSMQQVEERYYNPGNYLVGKVYPVKDGTANGYKFGQVNSDGQIHPGDDINWGTGSQDLGLPVYACEDSEVIGVFTGSTGFGNHVFLKAISNELTQEDMKELEELKQMEKDTQAHLQVIENKVQKIIDMATNTNGDNRWKVTGNKVSDLHDKAFPDQAKLTD